MKRMVKAFVLCAALQVVGALSCAAQEIGNGRLTVHLSRTDGSLVVADAESGRAWRSGAEFANAPVEVSDVVKTSPTSMVYRVKPRDWREFTCRASVDGGELDVAIEASAEATMTGYRLGYPFPFASEASDRFYFPNGCGLSIPCEAKDPSGIGDESINRALEKSQRGYQTSMKMGCWIQYAEKPAADGSLEQGAGMLAIVGTPWNIYLNFSKGDNGRRTVGLDWSPDMMRFGHARHIRYCFFTKATPGNLARRYRAEMERRGFRVTLKEKAAKYPAIAKNLELLKGAPNIWYWSERPDKVEKALELKKLGFGNMLFSTVTRRDLGVWITPEEKRHLAKIPGVLCTEYDIYCDTMEPEMVDKIDYLRPHWPLGVWDAGDYVVGGDGKPSRGWKVPLKSDPSKPCIGCLGLCERQAPPYIRARVAKLQAEAAIGARFFDVTGTGIGECWHPRHMVSRRESVKARQDMFRIAHEEFGLVAGTEDGLECYVPDVDYFEGVFNASYWRVDGGRYMWKIYEETPPVIKRSLDPTMRFPFWEMVFRDCVVGYWYWTCYNNKFPQDWWKMDLLNVIAGTPPMYLFTPEVFERQKNSLAASVKRAASTARATKDALLVEFRWLTADRLVQESVFSNGYRVIANFSDKPYVAPDGMVVPPRDFSSAHSRE